VKLESSNFVHRAVACVALETYLLDSDVGSACKLLMTGEFPLSNKLTSILGGLYFQGKVKIAHLISSIFKLFSENP
jgi:hypothetical protein